MMKSGVRKEKKTDDAGGVVTQSEDNMLLKSPTARDMMRAIHFSPSHCAEHIFYMSRDAMISRDVRGNACLIKIVVH